MKQDLNKSQDAINNIIDVLTGSGRSEKQIGILTFIL